MAIDAYLKLGSVAGESNDAEHGGWIEIDTLQFGACQPTSATSSTSGGHSSERVDHSGIKFIKKVDRATPILFQNQSGGTTFPEATIEIFRASGEKRIKYVQIKLKNVFLVSYDFLITDGTEPFETVTLKYSAIEVTYEQQGIDGKAKGQVVGSWNLKSNTPTYV